MALPSGLAKVTVTGTLTTPDGTPLKGSLVFQPEPNVLTSAAHGTFILGTVVESLTNGAFTVELLATDDPDVTPTGWTYRVEERLWDAPGRSYPLSLPAADPIVNLAEVAPTAPSSGEYVVVTGPAGPAGPAGITGAAGATGATGPQPPLGAAGAGDTTALKSTDPSTTNARTPTTHASTHATGSTDPITPAGIGAYTATAGADLEALRPDLPSDQGLLAWTYDPNMAGHVTAQSSGGVAGRVTLVRIILRRQITWSNIWLGLAGLDAGAALANCYLGVYDSSGNRVGVTADISTSLMSGATAKALPLTAPFTAAPGTYYIAMLLNGTWTTNSLTFKASGAGISVNAGLTPPNLRYSNMLTGQTSLPTTLSLASQATSIINTGWASQWYAIS